MFLYPHLGGAEKAEADRIEAETVGTNAEAEASARGLSSEGEHNSDSIESLQRSALKEEPVTEPDAVHGGYTEAVSLDTESRIDGHESSGKREREEDSENHEQHDSKRMQAEHIPESHA